MRTVAPKPNKLQISPRQIKAARASRLFAEGDQGGNLTFEEAFQHYAPMQIVSTQWTRCLKTFMQLRPRVQYRAGAVATCASWHFGGRPLGPSAPTKSYSLRQGCMQAVTAQLLRCCHSSGLMRSDPVDAFLAKLHELSQTGVARAPVAWGHLAARLL